MQYYNYHHACIHAYGAVGCFLPANHDNNNLICIAACEYIIVRKTYWQLNSMQFVSVLADCIMWLINF